MSLGYTRRMCPEMIDEALLEQRRRLGQDKRDEVWAGVLHMVPPASSDHQLVSRDLFRVLDRIARRTGLEVLYETGLFDPRYTGDDQEYRVPDLVVASREVISKRGIEGAATLVVEILSPGDESRKKLPFYAEMGVQEIWLIDPKARTVELFTAELEPTHTRDVVIRSRVLGIELATIEGKLEIRDGELIDTL
jgi:Uma2 family endonuclease